MNYKPHEFIDVMIYAMFLWFFIASLSSKRADNVSSVLILVWISITVLWMSKIPFDLNTKEYLNAYIQKREFLVQFDAVFSLIISMFLRYDKNAWKQALLLSFATICHIMIIYDLSIYSSSFSNLFYLYYDELIITIGFLQMMVAYAALVNGINNSRRTLSTMLRRIDDYCHGSIQNISTQKKTKANP